MSARSCAAAASRSPLDRPLVMGVVNVTPDSFSDGGRFVDAAGAIAHARRLVEEGADLLDIGGESTPPGRRAGAAGGGAARACCRCCEALRELGVPVSVDTRKPEVMRAALARGAAMINDINALARAGCARGGRARRDGGGVPDAHAGRAAHHAGGPALRRRGRRGARLPRRRASRACEAAGIARERIVVDPGFGFGKTVEHNLDAAARACGEHRGARGAGAGRLVAQVACSGDITGAAGRGPRWRRASPRRCSRCSAARESCACTTWRRRAMRSRCWRRARKASAA